MTPSDEQLAERGRALSFELEYLMRLVDDLRDISDLVAEAAADVATVSVAGLGIAAVGDPRATAYAADVMDSGSTAMRRLLAIQTAVGDMVELVEGRSRTLATAVAALQDGTL